jgi:hypothetical protein
MKNVLPNMKKLLLLLLIAPFMLMGCSKDDDETSYIDSIQEHIVGTWKYEDTGTVIEDGSKWHNISIYQFNTNMTFSSNSYSHNLSSNEESESSYSGNYTIDQLNKRVLLEVFTPSQGKVYLLVLELTNKKMKIGFGDPPTVFYKVD